MNENDKAWLDMRLLQSSPRERVGEIKCVYFTNVETQDTIETFITKLKL